MGEDYMYENDWEITPDGDYALVVSEEDWEWLNTFAYEDDYSDEMEQY